MKNIKLNLKPTQGIAMGGEPTIGYLFRDSAGNEHFINEYDYTICALAGGMANDLDFNHVLTIENEAYLIYINDSGIIEWIYDTDFDY